MTDPREAESQNATTEIGNRHLSQTHDGALKNLQEVVDNWIVPFLREWFTAGPQPIVGDREREAIQAWVQQNQRQRQIPDGYEWLPEILVMLAGSMRFSRSNFVNIHPTPHLPAVLASTLVSIQNPNNIVEAVSRQTTHLEAKCVEWMSERLVGFNPTESWGNIVSGGTVANITALLVARDYTYRKLARPRPAEVRTRGLYGLPPGVVITTRGSHYSVRKALWFLGMGDENVVSIPVAYDETVAFQAKRDQNFVRGITDPEWANLITRAIDQDRNHGEQELDRFYAGESRPFSLQPLTSEIFKALYGCFAYGTPLIAYVFTVGTTDTGTIERPNAEALKRLEEEDVYVHADAAAGGFALIHPRIRALVGGLEKVHSITMDGHKLGHLAYPNGAVLFRDHGWMYEILHEAPYLKHLAPTLEGSRPGSNIAALWASIQDLNQSNRYIRWLDRLLLFVDRLVSEFEATKRFQVHRVDLTTVAVAPRPKAGETRTKLNQLVEEMQQRIENDASRDAFLVNLDRGLSGIKVRDSNRPVQSGSREASATLVDVYCLRIVATNPAVEVEDASKLVAYLDRELAHARRRN